MAGRFGRSNGAGEMKETNVAMSGTVTDVNRGSFVSSSTTVI